MSQRGKQVKERKINFKCSKAGWQTGGLTVTFATHKSLKTQESQFGVDIDLLTAEQPADVPMLSGERLSLLRIA